MHKIPDEVMQQLSANPLYSQCLRRLALHDHECRGRMTLEHAIIYAGRQVPDLWAIVSLCAWAHSVDSFQDCGGMDKVINEWIALNKMTPEDEKKYPRRDWAQRRRYLNSVYGVMVLPDA